MASIERRLAILLILLSLQIPGVHALEKVLHNFNDPNAPANLVRHHVQAEWVESEGQGRLKVMFQKVDWPNIYFEAPAGGWDWSPYLGLEIEVTNPEGEAFEAAIRVDNAGAPENSNTARKLIPAGETTLLRCEFAVENDTPFWGMRGIPGRGPLPQGPKIDPTRITAFQLFLPMPDRERTLIIGDVRLFGDASISREKIPLPFVDRYGQYLHDSWPGKIESDEGLHHAAQLEVQDLSNHPALPGRDGLGAWAEGPTLEATGWFRTEKVGEKWWLVSPEGKLFFSTGVDCVGLWETTFVEGREGWFEWLPEGEGEYKPMFGYARNVHSMAERIGGEGRTFSFYQANLFRKHGEKFREKWRESVYRRLPSWGFNTIGNWSEASVLENSRIPFVAAASLGAGLRRIDGGEGYWSKPHDVFAPEFEEVVRKSLAWVTDRYSENPLCIGYFVDNELSWGNDEACSIAAWTLQSATDQPARRAFIADLTDKYGALDKLRENWGVAADSWEGLRLPATLSTAARADAEAFIRRYCAKYFSTVASQIRKEAPNQLYLGCRFSGFTRIAVEECAKEADVVSFNIYRKGVDPTAWEWFKEVDAPAIIGEFHFGAMDRGMFHPGLVEAADQAERAALYTDYVRSVAAHPNFVGCHWFQFIDEPITGRPYDGENYNIGFLTVTDSPYSEMVESARKVHSEVYRIRDGEETK